MDLMKICPACDRTYYDDGLNFCLMDGTALAEGESQPTVVIPKTTDDTAVISLGRPNVVDQENRGAGFWIGVTLLCIVCVTGATLGGFYTYFLFTADDGKLTNQNRNKRSTVPAKTPGKANITPVVGPSLAEKDPESPPSNTPQAKEIEWTTTALAYQTEVFARETFVCPPNGSESTVFGSDIYASNSSICTAAVHAGKINFEKGGKVTIIFSPGLSSYITSTRNNITTYMFGDEYSSFVFD